MRVSGLLSFFCHGLLGCTTSLLLGGAAHAQAAQRAIAGAAVPALPANALDAGALPGDESVSLTLYLSPPADRIAALDTFLAAVTTPGSPQYRQWLTPARFAAAYGATADQIQSVQAWAAQQGLGVGALSPSGTSLALTGTAAQVASALTTSLHSVTLNGQTYRMNAAVPAVPATVATSVLAVDNLSTVPGAHRFHLTTESAQAVSQDLLADLQAVIDANTTRILGIASDACVEDVDASTAAAMHLLLRQAAAQGITALISSGCNGRGSASYPGSLAEALSVASAPGITATSAPVLTEPRPVWQSAPGLPQDSLRHEPDLTVSSLADLQTAVTAILAREPAPADGSQPRLGNMAARLYSLAPVPELYTQPDSVAPGTWETSTGLGLVNLPLLIKTFATGSSAAGVSIVPTGPGSSNPYTIVYGGNQTYSITVTGQQGAPTGTVTVDFVQNGAALYSASVALTASSATASAATFQVSQLSTPPAAPQEYSVVATYNGDPSYRSGDQGQTSLYVNQAPVTLTASAAGSAGTLYVGGPYLVAVTASSSAGTPAGTLTITPDSGTAQTLPFPQNGSNQVTANFTATAAGTISVNVTCTATGSFVCNAAASTSVYVYKATPAVSAVSATNISAQAATLSATITGATGATAPSGKVVFTDASNTTLCTTSGSGAITAPVTCQSTNFPGTVSGTLTATYQGDGNYNSASATGSYTGSAVTTKTTLATIASPVVVNSNVNLVATITPSSNLNNTPPTGTITFYDNGTQIAQQAVANYQTQYTAAVTLTTQGTHSIYAIYSGDTNYQASTSATQSITIAPAPSAAVTASPGGSIPYGAKITLNAAISGLPNDGSNTLRGTIKFNVNGTDAVSQTVALANATGTSATASISVTQALDAGTYIVNLYCTGANFDCSSFNTSPFSFKIVPANTSTGVQVMPATFTAGQSVYATASIAPAVTATATGGTITGTVTFYDGANNVGTVSVYQSNGQFIATSSPFTVSSASDNIVAVYNGDGNNNSSTSTGGGGGVSTGPAAGTTTTVAANPLSALSGSVVSLTATVVATPAGGGPSPASSPTGTVNFYGTINGAQYLVGSASLGASGTATSTAVLATTGLRDGTNAISASFVGNSGFTASASMSTVTVQISDYALAFTPTSLNVNAGQSGKLTAAVGAVNGFSGQVTLACAAPSGSATTCSFDQTVINTSGLATLTVTTTARSASLVSRGVFEAGLGAASLAFVGLLLPAPLRRRRQWLAALFMLLVLGTGTGCTNLVNAAQTGTGIGSGTPAGSEVLTISTSGTSGTATVRHSYTVTVTVQ
jgi:trimeric autotransporter adhesin